MQMVQVVLGNGTGELTLMFFRNEFLLFPCSAPRSLDGTSVPKGPDWYDQLLWFECYITSQSRREQLKDMEYKL